MVTKLYPKKTCERWFDRFKNGNLNVKNNDHPGQPKKLDEVLQALLDEDDRQTQKQLGRKHSCVYGGISWVCCTMNSCNQ